MSKTQAFKAFNLIMRCLFWIMGMLISEYKASRGMDFSGVDLSVLDTIRYEYAEFRLAEE